MDYFFSMLKGVVDAVGIAIFTVSSVFIIIFGLLWQLAFGERRKAVKEEPIVPPVTPAIEKKAEAEATKASKKPDQSSVDFFNKLGKP